MVHQQPSTWISRAMQLLAIQTKLHPVDIGMEINIIIIEMKGLELLLKRISAASSIGPIHSCPHQALRAMEFYTAEVQLSCILKQTLEVILCQRQ